MTTSDQAPEDGADAQKEFWAAWRKAAKKWWQAVQARPKWRAGLERCDSLEQVMLQPGYVVLRRELFSVAEKHGRSDMQKLSHKGTALIAAVVVHVRDHSPKTLVAHMAAPREGSDRARMSELRFRRLLAYADPEDVRVPMIRAVRLVERKADVGALAEDLYRWTHKGGYVKRRWAESYYMGTIGDIEIQTGDDA